MLSFHKIDKVFIVTNILLLIMTTIGALFLYLKIDDFSGKLNNKIIESYKINLKNINLSIYSQLKIEAMKRGLTIKELLQDPEEQKRLKALLTKFNEINTKDVYIIYKEKNGPLKFLIDADLKQNHMDKPLFKVLKEMEKENSKELSVLLPTKEDKYTYFNRFKDGNTEFYFINRLPLKSFKSMDKEIVKIREYFIVLIISLILLSNIILVLGVLYSKLKNNLYTDKLTKLKNKEFIKYVPNLLNNKYIAMAIDIDYLNRINDMYNYKIGDMVIKHVSSILVKECSKNNNIIIRSNGGEFLIFSTELNKEIAYIRAKTFLSRLEVTPFIKEDERINLNITASIGIAAEYTSNINEMIEDARTALHKAKKAGRSNIVINENGCEESCEYSFDDIKKYIENDKLYFVYQPIITNYNNQKKIVFECLARLKDDHGNIISPNVFLDYISKGILQLEFTQKVLNNVFRMVEKYPQLYFSINIESSLLDNYKVLEMLFDFYNKKPALTNKIMIEILETDEITSYQKINKTINKIKNWGYLIAIDDFGSGYSNFSHVLSLNVDFIKIDGEIIRNILNNKQSSVIAKAIVMISKEIGIPLIAEYVSSEQILNKVKEFGITNIQGFYISPPLEEENIESFEKKYKNE